MLCGSRALVLCKIAAILFNNKVNQRCCINIVFYSCFNISVRATRQLHYDSLDIYIKHKSWVSCAPFLFLNWRRSYFHERVKGERSNCAVVHRKIDTLCNTTKIHETKTKRAIPTLVSYTLYFF